MDGFEVLMKVFQFLPGGELVVDHEIKRREGSPVKGVLTLGPALHLEADLYPDPLALGQGLGQDALRDGLVSRVHLQEVSGLGLDGGCVSF